MIKIILISILLITAPLSATRTKALREAAKEFNRRSIDLNEIDEIQRLERELRMQNMLNNLSRSRDSIRAEIEADLEDDRDTRRCLPIVSGLIKLTTALLNFVLIFR